MKIVVTFLTVLNAAKIRLKTKDNDTWQNKCLTMQNYHQIGGFNQKTQSFDPYLPAITLESCRDEDTTQEFNYNQNFQLEQNGFCITLSNLKDNSDFCALTTFNTGQQLYKTNCLSKNEAGFESQIFRFEESKLSAPCDDMFISATGANDDVGPGGVSKKQAVPLLAMDDSPNQIGLKHLEFEHLSKCEVITRDACDEKNCSHFCQIVNGEATCLCPSDWHLGPDGLTCDDSCINLGCSHGCHFGNTTECTCPENYILQDDSTTCVEDTNPCLDLTGCEQGCIIENGVAKCACSDGLLSSDGTTCLDECASKNCDQACSYQNDTAVCSCFDGFELETDGLSCIEVEENPCKNLACSHECLYLGPDNAECHCPDGLRLEADGLNCVSKTFLNSNGTFYFEDGSCLLFNGGPFRIDRGFKGTYGVLERRLGSRGFNIFAAEPGTDKAERCDNLYQNTFAYNETSLQIQALAGVKIPEKFSVESGKTYNPLSMCLQADSISTKNHRNKSAKWYVRVKGCDENEDRQKFSYDAITGKIIMQANPEMCLFIDKRPTRYGLAAVRIMHCHQQFTYHSTDEL